MVMKPDYEPLVSVRFANTYPYVAYCLRWIKSGK